MKIYFENIEFFIVVETFSTICLSTVCGEVRAWADMIFSGGALCHICPGFNSRCPHFTIPAVSLFNKHKCDNI